MKLADTREEGREHKYSDHGKFLKKMVMEVKLCPSGHSQLRVLH